MGVIRDHNGIAVNGAKNMSGVAKVPFSRDTDATIRSATIN